jgi:hypothetical protein
MILIDRLHRRAFVRAFACAGSAFAAFVGGSRGDEPKAEPIKKDDDEKTTTKPTDAEKPASRPAENATKNADPFEIEVEARMNLVLARFGERIDDKARVEVRREVEAIVRRARELRKYPLDNGDGPGPVFVPYRAPIA